MNLRDLLPAAIELLREEIEDSKSSVCRWCRDSWRDHDYDCWAARVLRLLAEHDAPKEGVGEPLADWSEGLWLNVRTQEIARVSIQFGERHLFRGHFGTTITAVHPQDQWVVLERRPA